MKRPWSVWTALLMVFCLCSGAALADTMALRVDFTHFDRSLLTSPRADEFYDVIEVDSEASFYYLQEFYLKQKFPELTNCGTALENALAFTNAGGAVFDGMRNMVDDVAELADGMPVVYLWLAADYLAASDADLIVIELLGADAYDAILPWNEARLLLGRVTAPARPVRQVFLNSRTVAMRLLAGGTDVAFTQMLEVAPGGLRLLLRPLEAGERVALRYDADALAYLEALGVTEVLVEQAQAQLVTVEALRAGLR